MHGFIKNIYSDINIYKWQQLHNTTVEETIYAISEKMGIPVHFYHHPSELNNLGGEWRIFLNQEQSQEDIWQDFGIKIAVYVCHQMFLEGKANKDLKDFHLYFCVPQFLLNQLFVCNYHLNSRQMAEEISKIFRVKYDFAELRLKLHCAS